MTNFIPLFPLALVVFPDEELNLHIFEPRYKQLVNDCFNNKKPFGVPAVINNEVQEYGTLVEILEISTVYENGEMDVKTRGTLIFKTLEKMETLPDKLYRGAIVTYPATKYMGSLPLMSKILESIRALHLILKVTKQFKKADADLLSFDVAHHAGMGLEDEYQLLQYEHELHRQEVIKIHLVKVLEVMTQMDKLKDKIMLNGHFKNLEGFGF
ncbi:MAG: LON peptidase substrate-binding domain-containing protein [Ferruginibacter sp.]|nr:LON peptidase substrate-binding domain-containing protein [Ferruginibacter sp.]